MFARCLSLGLSWAVKHRFDGRETSVKVGKQATVLELVRLLSASDTLIIHGISGTQRSSPTLLITHLGLVVPVPVAFRCFSGILVNSMKAAQISIFFIPLLLSCRGLQAYSSVASIIN